MTSNTEADILHIPNAKAVKMVAEEIAKKYEEKVKKQEWEEYKARRDAYTVEQMEDSRASIVIEDNEGIEGDNKRIEEEDITDNKEEGYEPPEERKFAKLELKLTLLYPIDQKERVMKFIEKIKNVINKFCKKSGIVVEVS